LRLGAARVSAEDVDQPIHVTRNVVACRIELEIHDTLGRVRFAGLDRAFEIDGNAVNKLQLVENAPNIVDRGGIVGQHVVERTYGGVVLSLDLLGGFLGLIGIRSGMNLVSGDAERFDGRLGFGERQPRRREMPRHHRVESVQLVEPCRQNQLATIDKTPSAAISNTAFIAIGRWSGFNLNIAAARELSDTTFYVTSVPIRLTTQLRCCKLSVIKHDA
jgi:hypothetical protein